MSIHFQEKKMKTMVGTPYYLAPEILTGSYGKECDIWSLGVVTYFLLSGRQPFESDDLKSLLTKTRKGQYDFRGIQWSSVST